MCYAQVRGTLLGTCAHNCALRLFTIGNGNLTHARTIMVLCNCAAQYRARKLNGETNMGKHTSGKGNTAPATTNAQIATIAAVPAAVGTGNAAPAKVRAVAVTQNGVARPKPGLCLQIWLETERLLGTGKVPTVVDLRNYAITNGYNVNNAQIEFYRAMKFNGVDPRSARQPQAGAVAPASK